MEPSDMPKAGELYNSLLIHYVNNFNHVKKSYKQS